MQEITLQTPSMQGKIYIGTGVLELRLPELLDGQKNFVVTDSNVYRLYGAFFEKYFPQTQIFVLPAGEAHKTFPYLQSILEKMTGAGLHRTSRLFAVGGGVVGDIAGLASALYMRGISCVQIPTTLLSQVDSSVGGKTAVDMNGVKNVVGAFYQPQEVLVDPTFLQTLPDREIKCGLGEIVKYGALDFDIFERLENAPLLDDIGFLSTLIAPCIQHKAKVVTIDEKETGERKSLNLGHTTAHAIELVYGYSHGECVLYGMRAETQMAIDKGVCDPGYGERLLAVVDRAIACKPNSVTAFSDMRTLAMNAKSDKKNTDDKEIVMSVAKDKGVWTILRLPYSEYASQLACILEKR